MRTPWRPVLAVNGLLAMATLCAPQGAGAQQVQAVPGPSDLQATAASASRIDLRWTRTNSGQVVQYRIYYSDGTFVAAVPASQSAYSDTGLQAWTVYQYYVTGANDAGSESPPSNVASARTLDGTPPSAPAGLQGSADGPTRISLTWSAATDGESGIADYVVYRNGAEIGRASGLTFADTGLTPDTQYAYEVSAINGQGDEGSRAGPVQVRTSAESPPDPPRALTAAPFSSSAIDLSWTPPADAGNVASYRIYRGGALAGSATGTSYRNTGLAPYTTYEYRVTSVNSAGLESLPSNTASARTLDGSPPTVPGNLAGSAASHTRISLAWSAATDPQTGIDEYIVFRGGSEVGRTAELGYQDEGLAPDTPYSYQVSAVNGQGAEGNRAGPVSVRTLANPAPDPPRDLSASALSASAIDVSWTPPADAGNVASYRIYRGGALAGTSSGTTYRDAGLAPYTTYEYRVTSVSGTGGESVPSNAASARTLDGTPPTVPGNLTGAGTSQSQISLAWAAASDPETDIATYVVYRDGGEIARTPALSYDDGGLESDEVYAYAVSAVNGQQVEGALAGPIEVRTLSSEAPDPPTGLSATLINASTVDAAWDTHPDHGDLTGYRLYRNGALVVETTGTAYRDEGLAPYTTFTYTVTAVGEDGDESAPSLPAEVTTPDLTPPTVPADVVATALGAADIALSWSPSVDEESGISNYRVLRDGSEVATPQDAGFQDTGLAAGTTYSYRISAVNAAGLESELSAAASATTLTDDGPPAPGGLTATPVNATQISLTWTAPEGGAASYRVFRDGAPIGSVTTTAFIDLGLEPATTYRYSVASVDAEGRQGPRSQEVSATTPPPVDLVPPAPPTGLRLVAP